MDDDELEVMWKGREATLVLRETEDEIRGYVDGKKHALTVVIGEDEDEVIETFCHDDLEYDEDELAELLLSEGEEGEDEGDEEDDEEDAEDEDEGDEEDEEGDEEDEEDEEDDEEDEEDEDEEIDEDEDADYGKPVKSANLPGVPTLHAVMVAYGSGIAVDEDVRLQRAFFRTLQEEKIVNVKETLLSGAAATAEKTLAAVKALRPAKDDVVWFLYSGHGCMEEGDRLLCTRGKMLRREAVSDAVKKVGARLSVVLSDCCAEEIGRVAPHEKLGAAGRPTNLGERLKRLFRGYAGSFDVTSSSDYQYSFGGVFTPTLIKKVLLGSAEDTWQGVLERTAKICIAEGEGAMSKEGRRALRAAGEAVIDGQKPIAYAMPDEVSSRR